ncbi:MAG TPA: hypothetical protein VF647_08545 [Longimicrobium sp.]|jgi:hypothetical protein
MARKLVPLCALIVIPDQAQAQFQRITSQPSPLESALENRLGVFRADCKLKWRSNTSDDQKLSSIPVVVRRRIKLDQPINESWRDVGARALFTYIFESNNLQPGIRRPERELPVQLVGLSDAPEPDSVQTSNIYSQTCISLAKAALSGDLRAIPIATIQMAASRQDTVSGAVVLAQGRFKSPLFSNLGAPGAQGLASHLALWEHYRGPGRALFNRQQPALHYITTFTGVVFFEQTASGSGSTGSGSARAGGSWVAGSLNADAELSVQRSSEMRSRTFDTFIHVNREGLPIATWDTLPSPRAISLRVRNLQPTPYGTDPKVVRGVPARVERQIEGIPSDLCNNSRWRLRASDTRVHSGHVEARARTCVFRVSFTTNVDSAKYTLPYSFVENTPIGNDTLIVPLTAALSRTPHPIPRPGPEMQRVAPAQHNVINRRTFAQWTVPVEFTDADAPVNFAVSAGDGVAELRCQSSGNASIAAVFKSADATQRVYTYEVTRTLTPAQAFSQASGDYDVCDMILTVQVPIVNQTDPAEKVFTIKDVILPRVVPAPTAPATPTVLGTAAGNP